MKITGSGRVTSKTIKKTGAKQASDGAAFSSALSGPQDTGQASNVGGPSPLATVDALLSLQEAPDSVSGGRSKGLNRANEMLDLLEEVRKGLLLGAIPVANLRSLASLARNQKATQGDQQLNEILEEIELRAEVELAKLGM
ncbi:flagellar assembly protein FliX [Kordiimonas sp. SCSIO 12610]|uniref:flagellar assembly protein FliX n=1 Tax=Kordiimonas sp. SCSIO 12610 TaxID=2829597 RepID=UPI0021088E48|nr:flagellar assembly protein FliX [Kordiimonas sp. SCSIO 12610]UTW54185.1 hypothetical protein KFF44_10120 [Kordiimonas sp. SCSIO 12610]